MSDKIEDGGPAFPFVEPATECNVSVGMTLRDYFAAKALASVYASAMADAAAGSGLFSYPDWRMGIALDAYAMADAMIAARSKR